MAKDRKIAVVRRLSRTMIRALGLDVEKFDAEMARLEAMPEDERNAVMTEQLRVVMPEAFTGEPAPSIRRRTPSACTDERGEFLITDRIDRLVTVMDEERARLGITNGEMFVHAMITFAGLAEEAPQADYLEALKFIVAYVKRDDEAARQHFATVTRACQI